MSGFRHRIIGMGKLQRINDFRMRSKEQLRRQMLRVHRSKNQVLERTRQVFTDQGRNIQDSKQSASLFIVIAD